jgi:hypothetical protein
MADEFEMLASMLMETTGKLADLCARGQDAQAGRQTLAVTARALRLPAIEALCFIEHAPVTDFARRLRETAAAQGVSYDPAFQEAAGSTDGSAVTWRQFQIAEAEHALACEPQLTGQQRLLDWTLRMAVAGGTLVTRIGPFARAAEESWLPAADLLLSLRFSTVVGEELPGQRVPRDNAQLDVDLLSETVSWTC